MTAEGAAGHIAVPAAEAAGECGAAGQQPDQPERLSGCSPAGLQLPSAAASARPPGAA